MSEKQVLSNAVGLVAWGYVLIFFNLNLGTVDILANWIGYIFINKAIIPLGAEEKSTLLLQPLALFLTICELLRWIGNIINFTATGFVISMVTTITAVISLYFHFQLLTNLATIADRYFCPQKKGLILLRTAYTILITISAVMPILPLPEDLLEVISVILIGITVVIIISSSSVLFGFKKALKEETL